MRRTAFLVVTAGAAFMACSNVCLTMLDTCRALPDANYPEKTDSGPIELDGGVIIDAGFAACVAPGCEAACASVTDFTFVCVNPDCLDCQINETSSGVFCGRVFTCGRDAGMTTDAAVRDASSPTDAGAPDAAVMTDAAVPDAAVALDAAVEDAAVTTDAG